MVVVIKEVGVVVFFENEEFFVEKSQVKYFGIVGIGIVNEFIVYQLLFVIFNIVIYIVDVFFVIVKYVQDNFVEVFIVVKFNLILMEVVFVFL